MQSHITTPKTFYSFPKKQQQKKHQIEQATFFRHNFSCISIFFIFTQKSCKNKYKEPKITNLVETGIGTQVEKLCIKNKTTKSKNVIDK